ncbi:MAG: hypothetical protein KDK69_04630, partial [Chlamydiia bacterium]|nr:hypothetical protein [Chlamydiia bacterium]
MSTDQALINPHHQFSVYGGSVALILATAGLFSRYESVKIIGMTTLSSYASFCINDLRYDANPNRYFIKEDETKIVIRSDNKYLCVLGTRLKAETILGGIFAGTLCAFASRYASNTTKSQLSVMQSAYPWITALVLSHLSAEALASREEDDLGRKLTRDFAYKWMHIASVIVVSLGTLIFREPAIQRALLRRAVIE